MGTRCVATIRYQTNGVRSMTNEEITIEAKNLCTYFSVSEGLLSGKKTVLKAVDDVSLFVRKGETLGLVGESGCGKTTLGKSIIHLIKPTGGKVTFEGKDLDGLTKLEMRKTRMRMQIVFQDPYGSLNTRMSVGALLQEPMLYHKIYGRKESEERVQEILRMVGLRPFHAHRYPHEFSGGQRQRIAIARALAVNPTFIVCDEPVSALDVSVQSQVLNLFSDLKHELHLTYLFISHDLSVVRHVSDRIGVMYLGRIVELAGERELYESPLHPYTRALFSAMPIPKAGVKAQRTVLQGDLPSPTNLPKGCRFHGRCPRCMDICTKEEPQLKDAGNGHLAACHLH